MNSHVEQAWPKATCRSSVSTGRASTSSAASGTGGVVAPSRNLLASSTDEEDDEGSAIKLKREIERMRDRCARLGTLVARLEAAQQREQQGEGEGDGDGEEGSEQLFTDLGGAEQRRQNVNFAAEEVQY